MTTFSQKNKEDMWDRYHTLVDREEFLMYVQDVCLANYPAERERYLKARKLWANTSLKLRIYERLLSGKNTNEYH